MKKLKLKKEVVSQLDSSAMGQIKGGNDSWTDTTAISSMYPSCICETLTGGPTLK